LVSSGFKGAVAPLDGGGLVLSTISRLTRAKHLPQSPPLLRIAASKINPLRKNKHKYWLCEAVIRLAQSDRPHALLQMSKAFPVFPQFFV
jgi:hypothetical protein